MKDERASRFINQTLTPEGSESPPLLENTLSKDASWEMTESVLYNSINPTSSAQRSRSNLHSPTMRAKTKLLNMFFRDCKSPGSKNAQNTIMDILERSFDERSSREFSLATLKSLEPPLDRSISGVPNALERAEATIAKWFKTPQKKEKQKSSLGKLDFIKSPTLRRMMHNDSNLRNMVEQDLNNEEEENKSPRKKKKKKLSTRDREYKIYYKLINYVLINNSDEYLRRRHKAAQRQKAISKQKPVDDTKNNFYKRMQDDIARRKETSVDQNEQTLHNSTQGFEQRFSEVDRKLSLHQGTQPLVNFKITPEKKLTVRIFSNVASPPRRFESGIASPIDSKKTQPQLVRLGSKLTKQPSGTE